jgi:hypothetical protein
VPNSGRLYLVANTVRFPTAHGLAESALPRIANWPAYYQLPAPLGVGRLSGPDRPSITSLDPPPGDFTFKHPLAASGPDGTLHLVWAEPNPDSLANYRDAAQQPAAQGSPMLLRMKQVYYARYEEETWSKPERIYREKRLGVLWRDESASFKAGPDGYLHLAFSLRSAAGGMVYLRRPPGAANWQADTLDHVAGRTALAVGAEGRRVVIAYKALKTNEGLDSQELRVSTTSDGGHTWAQATVLRPSQRVDNERGKGSVKKVAIAGRPGETLHVMWGRNTSANTFSAQSLWHARSTDGGKTWRAGKAVKLPQGGGFFTALQLVQDECGGMHALADVRGGERSAAQPFYTWKRPEAGWSAPQALADTTQIPVGTALTACQGRLWFLTVGEPSTGTEPPATVRYRTRPIQRFGDSP